MFQARGTRKKKAAGVFVCRCTGGVAVFTLPKGGLMYEASIGGQKFSFDRD
jgi:hypothetical protein